MLASLRSRIAISNLFITLIGFGILVFVFSQLATARSIEIKKQELAKQSAAVAQQVEKLFSAHGSTSDLPRQIDFESQLLGERIIVVGLRGQERRPKIVYDSKARTPFFSDFTYDLDQGALERGATVSYSSSLQGKQLVVFQSPLRGTRARHAIGAILLVARSEDVSPSTSSLLRLIGIAAGTALLVWLLIGAYFEFSISRPLLRIIQATGEMAHGRYGARVKVRGYGEIGRLASSFNTMAYQVQQSNQVLKDFLANVSHDLRTPLTMVIGFSQALLDGTARPDDVPAPAEVIHEEAIKMQRLVDDLLHLTRLESGLLTLERHPTDVRPFVQGVIEELERAHAGREVATTRNLVRADMPPMDADPERLERVLRNLLENAFQHTPADGSVTVRARPMATGFLEISVEDSGAGIPAEELPRVFERFYRSDKSRDRAHGHSGLGLAIVREIVEAHGGTVGVESEAGKGTTFCFTVPQASRPHPPAETPAPRESVQRTATQ